MGYRLSDVRIPVVVHKNVLLGLCLVYMEYSGKTYAVVHKFTV